MPHGPALLPARDWLNLCLALLYPAQPAGLAPAASPSVPLAEIINAVLYVLKNGCAWRDLPGDFSPWSTVYWYLTK